jgi:hypothetical protein
VDEDFGIRGVTSELIISMEDEAELQAAFDEKTKPPLPSGATKHTGSCA